MRGICGKAFATILGAVFKLALWLRYRVEVRGKKHLVPGRSTLIVSNHKRYLDMVVLGPAIHFRRGFWPGPRPWFIADEHIFEEGYLCYLWGLPWPLRWLAFRLVIARFVRALRAYPMYKIAAARVGMVLRQLQVYYGDLRLVEVLRPQALDRLAKQAGQSRESLQGKRVHEVLRFRYRRLLELRWEAGMALDSYCRRLRSTQTDVCRKQLEFFASLLKRGETLFVAAEGDLSPDGRLGRLKGGLYRVVHQANTSVLVQPVSVVYDFMALGRKRVIVNFGPETALPPGLGRRELEAQVRDSLVRAGVITMSQLGSWYLIQALGQGQQGTITEAGMGQALKERVTVLGRQGFSLDRQLLSPRTFQRRLRAFLRYCQQRGLLHLQGQGIYSIDREAVLHPGDREKNPVHYCYNEYLSLVPSLA